MIPPISITLTIVYVLFLFRLELYCNIQGGNINATAWRGYIDISG